MSKFPWVFWLSITIRTKWFSYFWKIRGSSFTELQLGIFRISIGRPWLKNVLDGKLRDYKNLDSARLTNEYNLLNPFSFQIGDY